MCCVKYKFIYIPPLTYTRPSLYPDLNRLPADPKAPSPNRGDGAMALLRACKTYGAFNLIYIYIDIDIDMN